MNGPKPKLPLWANGCPKPKAKETFHEYVSRLGMDPEWLLQGLTPQTVEVANARLATALMRACPEQFWKHVHARRMAAGGKHLRWPFYS